MRQPKPRPALSNPQQNRIPRPKNQAEERLKPCIQARVACHTAHLPFQVPDRLSPRQVPLRLCHGLDGIGFGETSIYLFRPLCVVTNENLSRCLRNSTNVPGIHLRKISFNNQSSPLSPALRSLRPATPRTQGGSHPPSKACLALSLRPRFEHAGFPGCADPNAPWSSSRPVARHIPSAPTPKTECQKRREDNNPLCLL
ncbi:hypothetical protein BC567DRAFT_214373 [Phyllosticta citribraziliensis]